MDAEKTQLMASPLSPLPQDRTQTAKTSVAPPRPALPTESRRRGGGLLRLLAPLLAGVLLLGGLAYALTSDLNPFDPGGTRDNTAAENRPEARTVEVPDVNGFGRDQAEATLRQSGFGVRVEPRESTFDEAGIVLDQSPGASEQVEEGSEITLGVCDGPTAVTVPDLGYESTAAADLDYAGLVLGGTTYEASDEFEAGLVIRSSPDEGTQAETGSTVNIVVSSGPSPVAAPSAPAPSDQSGGGGFGQGAQQGQGGQQEQGQPGNQNDGGGNDDIPALGGDIPGLDGDIPGLDGGGNGGGGNGSGGNGGDDGSYEEGGEN